MKYYYPAIFEPKNSAGFVLTIPDIKGCQPQGDDMEKAMFMAHEAIGCKLEGVEKKIIQKQVAPKILALKVIPQEVLLNLLSSIKKNIIATMHFYLKRMSNNLNRLKIFRRLFD